ncbi:hypothetical protein RFN29_30655 [Mesorhizobium sp. VK22B]|uniref:Nucleotidyltransferase n=1 Tax=Mesorhizobium captivum TaxID=3072319 RepID=A0ABU4ZBG4_9HYPH|nr:hypothetical protein [Mesorhizobium sp. VK22B]MDX8495908.1 hypothetical protein [Mesorhizobium sp. VK22B]
MWIAVTKRFSNFNSSIKLSQESKDDGLGKCRRITKILNKEYWEKEGEDDNRLMVGSWGKNTAIRPPYDVDMFFVLPAEDYYRFDAYTGNKQSALLQEVKEVIQATFPQTDMRGDGQVVQVKFNSLMIEVVPAFAIDNGTYFICDTNDGGKWQTVNPARELETLANSDRDHAYNTRRVARMMKIWRDYCNVDLASYVLEALVVRFFETYEHADKSLFWYDWICRDFLGHLCGKANQYVQTLDGGWHALGDAWKSRAESAWSRAIKACDYETVDRVADAGTEWQKIFGSYIEVTPA